MHLERTCNKLDKVCGIVRSTLGWLSRLDQSPVVYIAEDRTRVATECRSLLEFGLHSWGAKTDVWVGKRHALSTPGTLLVMNAHFGNRGTPEKSWRYWCLSLDVSRSSPLPGIAAAPMLSAVSLSDPTSVGRRYEGVAREYARRSPVRRERIKGAVLLLFAELLEDLLQARGGGATRHSVPIETALELMQRHYRDPGLSLGALARHAHLSEPHFGRLFRTEVGMAPMKYLRDMRLARARELLRRTRLTIAEIAHEVGYRDPAYFSRGFKAQVGQAPRCFRRAETVSCRPTPD
ncbi:MAG: helix-turn-helix transcriptional regulator [Kiritimatiellaeota bacterium]|nr:helix-turn-helix transcriptional regulator [Kiritimatiellota bacterium]